MPKVRVVLIVAKSYIDNFYDINLSKTPRLAGDAVLTLNVPSYGKDCVGT